MQACILAPTWVLLEVVICADRLINANISAFLVFLFPFLLLFLLAFLSLLVTVLLPPPFAAARGGQVDISGRETRESAGGRACAPGLSAPMRQQQYLLDSLEEPLLSRFRFFDFPIACFSFRYSHPQKQSIISEVNIESHLTSHLPGVAKRERERERERAFIREGNRIPRPALSLPGCPQNPSGPSSGQGGGHACHDQRYRLPCPGV